MSVTKYPLTWGSLGGVAATNTTNYTYGDSNWKDKLTSYNGQTISYDEIGNPLNYRGYTLTWQNGRQLESLSGNGTTASYTYDVDGLRTSKTVNGVKHEYYYVGNRLQYEKYDDIELWFFYDADGNPSGVRYDWDGLVLNYYFVCNWRGDVVQIYKENGALHASYEYDEWGNVLSVRSANGAIISSTYNIATINPLRYRGYYYDSETGMYYLKSRYYDPATKRFLNADGSDNLKPQSDLYDKNLYSYCDNNPIMCEDLDGNVWITAVAVGVGSQYTADIIGNLIAGKTGKDIFIPTSSIGEYVAAGVTALIPGSGLTGSLMRSAVSAGIYGIEKQIKRGDLTIADIAGKFASDFVFDFGISMAMSGVNQIIDSKLPKNYSSYAGKQYKNNAQITARQISKKMANSFKLGEGLSMVFEFMFNTMGNVLRK